MYVYTKLKGKLACWKIEDVSYLEAISAVRDELGVGHKGAILALVSHA